MSWNIYWESNASINQDILKIWAKEFCDKYYKEIGLSGNDIILDFGAGTGDVAIGLSSSAKLFFTYDKSMKMREILKKNIIGKPNIEIIEKLEDIRVKPNKIILNSVIQYISPVEMELIVSSLSKISQEKCEIIIADIIPGSYSKILDALELLWDACKKRFVMKFIFHMINEVLNNPVKALNSTELYKYERSTLKKLFFKYGWETKFISNLCFSKRRYTMIAYKI